MTHAHHTLIKSLVAEIRELRLELSDALEQAEYTSWDAHRAQESAAQARRDAEYQAQEAERAKTDAYYKDYDREQALRELERARSWGNEYQEKRAIDKLKRL